MLNSNRKGSGKNEIISFLRKFTFIFENFCLFFFLMLVNVNPQNFILHRGHGEDGDPAKDADGIKNNIIVWEGGKVHVAAGYNVPANYKLLIKQGAIVKICNFMQLDQVGSITYIEYGGALKSTDSGLIQIEGAVITDLRDDTEGGDTNLDGR